MNDNYISQTELEDIHFILEVLNVNLASGEVPSVSIGAFKIYDTNGEVLGTISRANREVWFALYDKDYNPEDV